MSRSNFTQAAETASADNLTVLRFSGYLTEFDLARQLGGTIRPGRDRLVLVDCLAMTDYSPAARQLFIDWNRAHKKDIFAVAIVTEKTLWHLVVSTMALASGQRMRAFSQLDSAMAWLSALNIPETSSGGSSRPASSRVRVR